MLEGWLTILAGFGMIGAGAFLMTQKDGGAAGTQLLLQGVAVVGLARKGNRAVKALEGHVKAEPPPVPLRDRGRVVPMAGPVPPAVPPA